MNKRVIIRADELRPGERFRVVLPDGSSHDFPYVVTAHPRLGREEGTTAVQTDGGVITFYNEHGPSRVEVVRDPDQQPDDGQQLTLPDS
jgi:hypothetical protein